MLVSRPKAVLGKKPPWSAPFGPPSPDSVNSMIARPPLLGVAAMAGMSRSSCLGETYPWLVRVNFRSCRTSGCRLPSTPRPVDFRVGAGVCLGELGAGRCPELALRLRDLRQVVAVGGDPALGAGGGRGEPSAQAGRPAFVAERYRAGLLRGEDPDLLTGSGS